ncbi:MAG: transglutaminase family protein [Alphaproteobacteria bacterium]|nr:transglutaminase family protein [Alphaproteobacteria bacterium]
MEPAPDSLRPARFIDSDHPAIQAYAAAKAGGGDDLSRALRLYYAVRDEILYDPYGVTLTPEAFKASVCLARGRGFCVEKAGLLAAVARAAAIPARVGFADVRNHLTTERLRRIMGGSDLFVYHGFAELWLEGRWVKATPAFNLTLCRRFGVKPLEFDGRSDSIFHPFDASGRQHMEYVADRGSHDDIPYDDIKRAFAQHYPGMFVGAQAVPSGADFGADGEAERRRI